MGMTAALMAMTVAQAGTQIAGGYAQKREADYNAGLLNRQAAMIGEQQKLEAMQYDRAIRKTAGTTIARTAASGIQMSGSPMAVMIDTMTQMHMDKAIGQYNLEMEKQYTYGQTGMEKARGKRALSAGYTGAFSTLLQGGRQFLGGQTFVKDPKGSYNVGYGRGTYPGGYSGMSGLR